MAFAMFCVGRALLLPRGRLSTFAAAMRPSTRCASAIGRRDFQRLLRRAHRVVDPVVPQVQPGQFRRNIGRQRIELHRLLVGGDRARHVVVLLEMMADEELLVRLSHLRRLCGPAVGARECARPEPPPSTGTARHTAVTRTASFILLNCSTKA